MNLREYLRNEWSQYIRPMMVKDECEWCGSSEELHLHHIEKFDSLLIETLNELQLQELDTMHYDEMELKMISNFMLAKQVKCKYQTLCKDCHTEEHKKEREERRLQKELEKQKYINGILIPYLESIVGVEMLQVKDRKELIEKIDVKSNGKMLKKINNLNGALEEREVNYRIVEFSTSNMINGKQKKYPNAWKVSRLINKD